jgi:hypothetical protein
MSNMELLTAASKIKMHHTHFLLELSVHHSFPTVKYSTILHVASSTTVHTTVLALTIAQLPNRKPLINEVCSFQFHTQCGHNN